MNTVQRASIEFDTHHEVRCGDCADLMAETASGSVDLIFGSPPYEAQRTYGIGFALRGRDWVAWAADRYEECYRVSRGLSAWVVAGSTRGYRWSATPALLMAELARRGVRLRNPAVYKRHGIPGSGGPDWLRSDYEWVVCASVGKLPWSDNTAMGHEPVCGPGGAPSHRRKDGKRLTARRKSGVEAQAYKPPKLANPGNVIDCGAVGGGNIGSKLAHENEAPFPESLAEFFILSFCPPGGTVLDPFCGSGTTAAVAKRLGRNSISLDVRESQCDLVRRRLDEVHDEMVESMAKKKAVKKNVGATKTAKAKGKRDLPGQKVMPHGPKKVDALEKAGAAYNASKSKLAAAKEDLVNREGAVFDLMKSKRIKSYTVAGWTFSRTPGSESLSVKKAS